MRLAWVIAAKEFRHMMHDRFTLVLTLGLPLFQLLLFGYALQTSIHDVPTGILDLDQRPQSRSLVKVFESVPLFRVERTLASPADADAALRRGELKAVIEIPKGFATALVYNRASELKLVVDGSDTALANYLRVAAHTVALEQSVEHLMQGQPDPGGIRVRTQFLYGDADDRSATFLVPGLVAVLTQMITTLLLSLSIVKEHESGTLSQILTTRVGRRALVDGKLLAAMLVGAGEALALFAILRGVFGIAIQGGVLVLLAIVPILVIAPAAIGLLIAARARHQAQALQLTYLIFLPSVLLSGFVFPRWVMPVPAQWLSALLPTTYAVDLVRGIVLRGTVPSSSLLPAIALAVVLIVVGRMRAIHSIGRPWN